MTPRRTRQSTHGWSFTGWSIVCEPRLGAGLYALSGNRPRDGRQPTGSVRQLKVFEETNNLAEVVRRMLAERAAADALGEPVSAFTEVLHRFFIDIASTSPLRWFE